MVFEIVGRQDELASLHAFIDEVERGPAALPLEGEAGIGKSTLWLAGVRHAHMGGCRVLSLILPADVVAGSYVWAPDGHWAAFLTQAAAGPGGADFVALCAVDSSARGAISGFRYVADLAKLSDASRPMPVAAVAWSATGDGRLAYAAPFRDNP